MSAEPFYILAIDGGGIRGVFPAHILKCIQSRLKVSLLRKFGMISGTSNGAIVAAAVALDIDLEKVIALYREHGEAIFKRRRFWGPTRFEPAIRSRYEKNALMKCLEGKLSAKSLFRCCSQRQTLEMAEFMFLSQIIPASLPEIQASF